MEHSKKITDGALLLGIYAVLLILAMFIPMFLVVAIFLLPIPFIVYASKYSWQPASIMMVAAIILSFMIIPAVSIPLTLLAGFGGIMIGNAISRRATPYETWAQGSFGFVVGIIAIFLFTQFILGINLITELDAIFKDSIQMSTQIANQFGFGTLTEEEILIIENSFMRMLDLIPVGVAISAIMIAFLSQWFGYKVLNRFYGKQLQFPPIRNFKLPIAIVWIYFIAILLSLFGQDLNDNLNLVVNNVVTLVGLLMVLQGFSFIFFFAHHKGKSNALPILSVILTILFPFLFLYLVRILGIIDIGFDLRKRLSDGNNHKGS